MNPAASAFATPTHERARCATKRNGHGAEAGRKRGHERGGEDGEDAGSSIAQSGFAGWAKMTSTLSCS